MTQPHAVVFGAGNVGRGFLGQLFSESGYEVVFVDIDGPLIAALNERRGYTIRLVDNERAEEVVVSPVRALLSSDHQEVAEALATAAIAATAVGVRALPYIAPLVAEAISLRAGGGPNLRLAPGGTARETTGHPSPLNIIICENLKNAAAAFNRMVVEHLPEHLLPYMEANVGFVDTVIARMVPPPTEEMRQEDPSLILVEPYKELPVDRSGFAGPIPEITGMQPIDNFAIYTARKLYVHNCGHAMLGYLGYQRGHTYGYDALEDKVIRPLLEAALAESNGGIVAAHDADPQWLQAHMADLLRRFANRALGDTVLRLARDPLRKLAPTDRLVGAARLAEQAGQTPRALSWGIAAGYRFDHADDPLAMKLQQRITAEGFDQVLADVSGISADEPLAALVRERYVELDEGSWP